MCIRDRVDTAELRWIVAHQANQRILDGVAWNLDVPKEKLLTTLETTGNTSSSSIPICIHKYWRKLNKGSGPALLTAFGAGFTVASTLAFPKETNEKTQ